MEKRESILNRGNSKNKSVEMREKMVGVNCEYLLLAEVLEMVLER